MSNGSDYAVPGGYDPYYASSEYASLGGSDYTVPDGYDPYTNTTPSNASSGWLNAVTNFLPAVGKIVTSIYSAKTDQNTTLPNSQPVVNGVNPQVKSGSLITPQASLASQASSSNMLLYLIGGGALLLILLMKR